MARSVTVNTANTIVGGLARRAADVVVITNTEFSALTTAGRFSDGTLTDGGAVATADDAVGVQGVDVANLGALTSANAAGGTPTAAEHNALVADVGTLRTALNALLTSLRGPDKPMA